VSESDLIPRQSRSADALQPRLGITTGDPAGVGPEISLLAASDPSLDRLCRILLIGDSEVLRTRSRMLGLPFHFDLLRPEQLDGCESIPERAILDVPAPSSQIRPGHGSPLSGAAAARNVVECVRLCRASRLDAMITAPLSKRHLNEAGFPFPGHTEFLAQLTGADDVAMGFLSQRLKVVLVTVHLPLRTAVEGITPEIILNRIDLTVREFKRFRLPCRTLAVAGINPHAGEDGLLGSEEQERILPAVHAARGRHPDIDIAGPLPGDTVFARALQGEFDVVLAMYHDQGLIPVKLLGFGEAVNVTLGIPFVRTSVDHGTAFDIAGKGVARPDSMICAVRWALQLTGSG